METGSKSGENPGGRRMNEDHEPGRFLFFRKVE